MRAHLHPTHIHIDMGIYVNTHWYTGQVSWPEEILLFALLQDWWLPYLYFSAIADQQCMGEKQKDTQCL